MKKLLYNILVSAVLLFSAASCEDVLDQQAVDTFNEGLVFSDINVVRAYLGKTYDRMGGNTDAGILGGREDLLSSGTDQTLCIHRPANYVMIKGTMSPDQLGIFVNNGLGGYLRWNNLYANIQDANRILGNIDEVKTSTSTEEALKKQIKGEAYFIRAYDYSTLMMVYGGSILQDKPFKLGEDYNSINRSSIKETLDFILKDINLAIENLPANMQQGRANRAAAAALKSRVLLFAASRLTNGGYEPNNPLVSFPAGSQAALLQQARDAAKDVMDGKYGNFALVGSTDDPPSPMTDADVQAYANTYFGIFNQKGTWNTETIWGIQFPLTGGNQNNANLWYGPNGYHNWGNNNPTEPMVRAYEMADGTPFVWDKYSPGNMDLRAATAAELAADPLRSPYNGREPRFYASVLYNGAPWQQRPSDAAGLEPNNVIETGYWYANVGDKDPYKKGLDTRQGLIEAWNGTKTGYYIRKLLDPATAGQYFRNTNTWVEFRYAEILLNYAEACIEIGGADLQNGINALNMVRNRAGLPDRVTTDQAIAREYLRHERNIEFFAEGHRFYDMRRWMIANNIIQNVHEMKVKIYNNGYTEWLHDKSAVSDARVFNDNKFYWVPFPRDEMNKAPQLQQNPGYN
jgi:starch-binding outer membrane protein, SusD/RagB family